MSCGPLPMDALAGHTSRQARHVPVGPLTPLLGEGRLPGTG